MRSLSAVAALSSVFLTQLAYAQTYSTCNPLMQSCPPNPALGGSKSISFTSGPSSDFRPSGNGVSYNSEGAQLTVSQQGDNPTLSSKWYLMFGHVDMTFKSAPGTGMVSSAILISDDLDEVDWEILGVDDSSAQTNYFGKGITGSYNRGAFVSAPDNQGEFNTYSIDWTADRIEWQLNGKTMRTLYASDAGDQYPQTPMQVKVGSWAGGDSTNNAGTIKWAGGPINYADGPFTMVVQSVSATDYSTGTSYQYSGTDGSWGEVQANGGSVNPSGTPGSSTPVPTDPPASGPHSAATSTWLGITSSGSATLSPASASSAWESQYGSGGHPSKNHPQASPTLSSSASSLGGSAAGGCDVISAWNEKGSLTTMTVSSGYKATYDSSGALITPPPCKAAAVATSTSVIAVSSAPTSSRLVTSVRSSQPVVPVASHNGSMPTTTQPPPSNAAASPIISSGTVLAGLATAFLAVML